MHKNYSRNARCDQIAFSCRNTTPSWVDEYRTGSGSDRVGLAINKSPFHMNRRERQLTITVNSTLRRPGRYRFRFCIRRPTMQTDSARKFIRLSGGSSLPCYRACDFLCKAVKLMFEMTNASECHRDAVFFCGGDRFVVFDRSAETGDWCQACARLLSLWERLGEGAKLESQKCKPDPGFGFLFHNLID